MLPDNFIIKVCGMTRADECSALVGSGVSHTGFIFYAPSPRNAIAVNPDDIKKVGEDFQTVGVFVDCTLSDIYGTVSPRNMKVVQLHGNETPEDCSCIKEKGLKVIKAFRVGNDWTGSVLESKTKPYQECCDLFLFDTGGRSVGGNGVKFNWEILNGYKGKIDYLLSGGITPDDAGILKTFISKNQGKLKGIDINSGFEIYPGHKNVESIKNFIHELSS